MPQITPQQLRYNFPEFASTTVYLDSQISFWLGLAYLMLNANRWGSILDTGAQLFAAHHLTLEARDKAAADNGGIPGQNTGPVSSKSVDKVSISYDTGASIDAEAGHWNLTTYGTRFRQLMKLFGAGPVQIGVGQVDPLSGLAWPGPDTTPSMTGFS